MTQKRRFTLLRAWLEPTLDLLGLSAILFLLISYMPAAVFNPRPATGGDTGSHFWPLSTMLDYSLPNFTVRVWNPGNLGGEPHLLNYFPVPYLIMALLSSVMPRGMAFNLGSLLPAVALPLSIYIGSKSAGLRFPAPLFSAATSLIFLLNESFSMWGGNFLSLLAGQFAHAYALCFLILGTGLLCREIRRNKIPFWSVIIYSVVAASHSYVFLGVPFILCSVLFCQPLGPIGRRFWSCVKCGLFSLLLAAWFVVPMLDNAPWTTPFAISWDSQNLLNEAFPRIFYPIPIIIALSSVVLACKRAWWPCLRVLWLFWIFPCLGYLGCYFLFPYIGLVDVRALPQIELFGTLLAGALAGVMLRAISRTVTLVFAPACILAALWWVNLNVAKLPTWLEWNYTGWENKPLYRYLQALSREIRGDFSMPRVIYEHNMVNHGAGTERVFEMLPYFAGRATLESVYLQASILAPAVFHLQAEVSKTPSCPFQQFECPKYDLQSALPRLALMGVGTYILITPELRNQARGISILTARGSFGPWHLFESSSPPALVETFKNKPLRISDPFWKNRYFVRARTLKNPQVDSPRIPVDSSDWKEVFYQWFINYQGTQPMIVLDSGPGRIPYKLLDDEPQWWDPEQFCSPKVKVLLNQLIVETDCPGKAHFLKFSYHPSWKADSGDPIFMVSPGFLAFVPSTPRVVLTFGPRRLWQAAGALSILSLLLLSILYCRQRVYDQSDQCDFTGLVNTN